MIPQDVLLKVLLEHPDFKDFEKKGNDYRDHSGAQSLTERGLKDFKSDEYTSLFKLAKNRNLLDEARSRAGLDQFKSKQPTSKIFQTSTAKSDIAKKIWEHAEGNTEQLSKKAQQYLGGHRKILPSAY